MIPIGTPQPLSTMRMNSARKRHLRGELMRHEELLWAGRPKQGVYLSRSDIVQIPFSLLWGGFAIVWEVVAISSGAPFHFSLCALPFVAVGLHLMLGRFYLDTRVRSHTFYGVTNLRVLILTGPRMRNLTSIDLARLRLCERVPWEAPQSGR
jgi:hypothetical protein